MELIVNLHIEHLPEGVYLASRAVGRNSGLPRIAPDG